MHRHRVTPQLGHPGWPNGVQCWPNKVESQFQGVAVSVPLQPKDGLAHAGAMSAVVSWVLPSKPWWPNGVLCWTNKVEESRLVENGRNFTRGWGALSKFRCNQETVWAMSDVFCWDPFSKPWTTKGGPMGFNVGPIKSKVKTCKKLTKFQGRGAVFKFCCNQETAWATLGPCMLYSA